MLITTAGHRKTFTWIETGDLVIVRQANCYGPLLSPDR